jgi:hypothetical protein
MEHIAQTVLPDSMGYEWMGIAYEEKKSAARPS